MLWVCGFSHLGRINDEVSSIAQDMRRTGWGHVPINLHPVRTRPNVTFIVARATGRNMILISEARAQCGLSTRIKEIAFSCCRSCICKKINMEGSNAPTRPPRAAQGGGGGGGGSFLICGMWNRGSKLKVHAGASIISARMLMQHGSIGLPVPNYDHACGFKCMMTEGAVQ